MIFRENKTRPRGYVLLIVIAVLTLIMMTLSMYAQSSLKRGLAAEDTARQLQIKWGERTLRETVLGRADKVFDARHQLFLNQLKLNSNASAATPPPPMIRDAITLNGVTFDLLLGDEDSKVDLNLLYHHGGMQAVEKQLRESLGPLSAAVRLVPAVEPMEISREQPKAKVATDPSDDADSDKANESTTEQAGPARAFRSWGEVFDVDRLKSLTGSNDALPNLNANLTIAGSGQVGMARATDEALGATLAIVIGDGGARRLRQRYRQNPTAAIDALLVSEVSQDRDRVRLTMLIQETGKNYSLWIDASTLGGHRLRQWVTSRISEEGSPRTERFAF
jgi:hypothetical protein